MIFKLLLPWQIEVRIFSSTFHEKKLLNYYHFIFSEKSIFLYESRINFPSLQGKTRLLVPQTPQILS